MSKITISPANDFSLIIEGLEDKTAIFLSLLEKQLKKWILDSVPAYSSLLIYYDVLSISYEELAEKIENLWINKQSLLQDNASQKTTLHQIPTFYGKEVGLDLEELALSKNISIQQIAEIHSSLIYKVFAIGFRPGFAYLGSLKETISFPRRKIPRIAIPKGSIAIAHKQTAIYPNKGPGGWNIIGKTYIDMVDFQKENPCLLQVGDKVQFRSITKEEFLSQGGEIGS